MLAQAKNTPSLPNLGFTLQIIPVTMATTTIIPAPIAITAHSGRPNIIDEDLTVAAGLDLWRKFIHNIASNTNRTHRSSTSVEQLLFLSTQLTLMVLAGKNCHHCFTFAVWTKSWWHIHNCCGSKAPTRPVKQILEHVLPREVCMLLMLRKRDTFIHRIVLLRVYEVAWHGM